MFSWTEKVGAVLCLGALVTGCSGGRGTTATVPTNPPTGTSSVTLAQTIMVGDADPNNWLWVQSDFGAFVPCGGTGTDIETFHSCYQANFVSICDSGCQPGPFQQVVSGKKRVVLFVGTEDAQSICHGLSQFGSDGLSESIDAIKALYKMQVWVATIPEIVDKHGSPTCAAAVATINQEIESVAASQGAKVVDFHALMTAPADYDSTREISDEHGYADYLPSTTGYVAMQSAYEAVKQ